MENVTTIKLGVFGVIGAVGSLIASLLGGWSMALQTLMVCMAVDYVTGLMVAGVFKNSPKTETGALESRAGFKGLCRKGVILLIVLIAYRLDLTVGSSFIQNAVIIGYIANESVSIVENVGLMGLWVPGPLLNAIDVLKKDSENDNQGA